MAATLTGLPGIGDTVPHGGMILDMAEGREGVLLLLDTSDPFGSGRREFTVARFDPDTGRFDRSVTFPSVDLARDNLSVR